MTLSQLADIGEIVGGIAVVASLVYLAIQIRQNTMTVKASTLHHNTDLWVASFLRLADPELASAYVAGMSGRPDIKPSHFSQFFFICRSMFLAFENQFYQMNQGMLDADAYASYQRSISTQLLAFPGFRIWWQLNRLMYSQAFADHVDSMIEGVPEADPEVLLRDWQTVAKQRMPTA